MSLTFVNNSATISTTEYSLPANTTTGVPTSQTDDAFVETWIDFANMVAGDQYRIRLYEKINAGTQRVVLDVILNGAQSNPYIIPGRILGEGWDVTVVKVAGTDRSIAWSLRKDDRLNVQLIDGTLTAAKFAADAITSTVVADNTITSAKIGAGAITTNKIGAGAFTAAVFGADAIDAAKISAAAVDKIADGLLARVYEGTRTVQHFFRMAAAVLYGKATAPTGDGSFAFRDDADTKNRVAGSLATGARTITTRDGT